jgi:hypothetical protein
MRWVALVFVVLFLVMMCGCAKVEDEGIQKGRWVHEVVLSDGTRCAVVARYSHPGGIDCDFKSERVEQ